MTLKTNNSNDHTVSEAVSVNKKNYSWGKMITVHQGKDTSYPLHPEHQAKIKALKPGEKTSFTDETNKTVHAEREGDKVHLSSKGTSKKTTVAHSHFTEQRDFFSLRDSLVEKTLTSAEKKKREEIAQAMERENPGMPMAKKMAIATAQAKKVAEETYSDTGWKPQQKVKKDPYGNVIKNRAKSLAKQGIKSAIKDLKKGPEAGKRQVEEVEQIDELKVSTLTRYGTKAMQAYGRNPEKDDKRLQGIQRARAKVQQKTMKKEEVEHLEEGRFAREFKNRNSKERTFGPWLSQTWKNEANDRGHTVETIPHPKGHDAEYYIAKNKEGKKVGHYDMHSKRGKLSEDVELDEAMDHAQMATMHSAKAKEHGKMAASYHGTDSSDLADRHMELYNAHKDAADAHRQAAKSNNPEDAKKAEEAHKDAQWLSKQYNESVELGEELTYAQKDTHFKLMNKHRLAAKSAKGAEKDKHRMAAYDHQHALQNPWYAKSHNDAMAASKRLGVTESVELDEAETSKLYNYAFDKYADITSGKNKKDKAKAPGYERIARNAWKMGISRPLKKSNLPEEYENPEMEKVDMAKTQAHFLKYAAEEILEYLDSGGKIEEWYQNKLSKVHSDMEGLHSWMEGNKRKEGMAEGVNLDEAMRHEIAGQVARFIGNKIDPVHGDIMHMHGKEAYRQAAYHIRKTVHHVSRAVSDLHDRLHKQLRTGGLATEEASPMIKAPKNEFGTKADAFAHAKKHGGKVMKKTFTHPTSGQKHVSYVVKKEAELEEGKYGAFRGPSLTGRGIGVRSKGFHTSQPNNYHEFNKGLPMGFYTPKDKESEEKKPEETKKTLTGRKQ